MRRSAGISVILLLSVLTAAAQVDSTRLKELDSRLGQYFSLLETQGTDVKVQECDALIEAAQDSALKQTIALKAYDHYKASPVMGDEAVAIHLTDKWFSSGLVAMRSETELLDARIFADCNRQSLLGMTAPSLTLLDGDGAPVVVPGQASAFTVLYFFDTDCAKCKLETAMLRSLLNDKDYPIEVVTVYVGRDEARWHEWIQDKFTIGAEQTEVLHLWDPDVKSDYISKYGVLQTPRMFLVDPDGTIVGRGLDTEALEQLLGALLEDWEYSYGSQESKDLFDKVFATYGSELSPDKVLEVARMLEDRTLAAGDTLSFKHLEGDLLYYLSSRSEEAFKEGTLPFVNEYVFGRPDIWDTEDDELMVVGMADMLRGLLEKTPVGSKIPREPLKGWNKFRRQGGFIFFHAEGCPVCEAQMARADSLGIRYYSVDMDALEESKPSLAGKLLDTFDLSGLPLVLEIGKGGVVKRRYVDMVE